MTVENFNFDQVKTCVLQFIESLRVPDKIFLYRYSKSCIQPTLYASAYACMTKSMLGDLANLDMKERSVWIAYFDSFQDPRDGLFYDPVLLNELYADTDWWGARHLALHMISTYTDLNARPRYPFIFLKPYYDVNFMKAWLDQYDWHSAAIGRDDPDNKIMNIGCLLQHQRDAWKDEAAGVAVENLKIYLREKINPATGMWGGFDVSNENQRSRMVQFAYHLFPIFFYDGDFNFDADKIVQIVLKTQNRFGGFGVPLNSSACEDIDSIDILIRLAPFVPNLKLAIDAALRDAFTWVLCNQVNDAGFVFRLYESFVYGHIETSSKANEGAMLATWFRILSIAYLINYFSIPNNFFINRCPSYEF